MKIRAGILGCGLIGSQQDEVNGSGEYPKTHALAYQSVPGFELTALCDKNEERLREAQKRWATHSATTNIGEFLELNLDVISICTPPKGRADLIENILKTSTTRILFCEKPLAMDRSEVTRIIELARQFNASILVNFIRRFDEEIARAHSRILSGEFGRPQKVVCHYSKGLRNNGSHLLDLLNMFFGRCLSARHLETIHDDRAATGDPTESAMLRYSFSSPSPLSTVPVFITGQDHRFYSMFEMDIHLENGRIIISENARKVTYFRSQTDNDYPTYKTLALAQIAEGCLRKTFITALNELDCIFKKLESKLSSTPEDSLQIMTILDAIQASRSKNGQEVQI